MCVCAYTCAFAAAPFYVCVCVASFHVCGLRCAGVPAAEQVEADARVSAVAGALAGAAPGVVPVLGSAAYHDQASPRKPKQVGGHAATAKQPPGHQRPVGMQLLGAASGSKILRERVPPGGARPPPDPPTLARPPASPSTPSHEEQQQ